ncbi:MAG: hypothetical protein J5I94_31070 [Phaeodactylibacter sp.]|nr:hypothetical protein [Phaeodactylibacter sp.]
MSRRYPGAKPFTRGQQALFYGRDKDIAELHRLVSLEPLAVLYGKSGLGKSSLLNAGLIPKLEENENNRPLLLRFQAWTEESRQSPLDKVTETLDTLPQDAAALSRLAPGDDSLWRQAKAIQYARPQARLLLLFDQFEELFSYPEAEIQAYKQQLAELLRQQPPERYEQVLDIAAGRGETPLSAEEEALLYAPLNLRILFSIRSDRLHLLDQLSDYLPTVLKNNYELLALTPDAARRALIVPAGLEGEGFDSKPFKYTEPAAKHILGFLKDKETGLVEAIQLQILCTSFEDKAIAEGIRTFDQDTIGNLEDIIRNFYHRQLEKVHGPEDRLAAARLLEEGLLDKSRKQRLTLHESQIGELFDVSPTLLNQLVNNNLLRREPDRRQGYTYELSHDTLIAPALAAREQREKEEAEAERQRQAAELEEEKHKRKLANRRAYLAGLITLVAFIATYWAFSESRRAKKAESTAEFAKEVALMQAQRADSLLDISEARLNEIKAAKAATDTALQRADSLYNEAELQRRLAELEAAKGRQLESTLAGEDTEAFGYLLEQGRQHFEQGEYRNALTYWANARFLRPGNGKVEKWVDLAQIGAEAEQAFREGYLEEAERKFAVIKAANPGLNLKSINTRLVQISTSWDVWKAAIKRSGNGKKPEEIVNLYLYGDITSIPQSAKGMASLRNCRITSNNQEEIFLSALPKQLDSLEFFEVGFINIPAAVFTQKQLKKLEIYRASRIVNIPEQIGDLAELIKLGINDNNNLKAIPEAIHRLQKLQQLRIYDNDILHGLPASLGELAELQQLDIESNHNLTYIPESIGQLKKLRKLVIGSNWDLDSLPGSIGQLQQLLQLEISDNWRLKSIPESIGRLQQLQQLEIFKNEDLTSLPGSIGQLKELRQLAISWNENLESLPTSLMGLPMLSNLTISYVYESGKPHNAPQVLEQMQGLKRLTIIRSDSTGMDHLIRSASSLRQLLQLDIGYNHLLKSLPESIGQCRQLQQLFIYDNENLQRLPESLGQLTSLRTLGFTGGHELWNQYISQLPSSIGQLANLDTLNLRRLDLNTLPSTLENLKGNLGYLNLRDTPIVKNEEAIEQWREKLPDTKIVIGWEW